MTKFLASLLLYIIESSERILKFRNVSKDETLETFLVRSNLRVLSHVCKNEKSSCINSRLHPDNTRSLQKVHRCQMEYLYELEFEDGRKTVVSKDHPLIMETYGTFTLEKFGISSCLSFRRRKIDVSHRHIYIINLEGGVSKLISVERSFFPQMTYDISVSCDRLYFSDGLLNHNCVTSDTKVEVKVKDKGEDVEDTEENHGSVSIFELFYKNKRNKTFLDRLIYFLFRQKQKFK